METQFMKKTFLILTAVFSLALAASAQKAPQAFAVKTDNGLAIFYNNGANSFAFELVGKDIKPQTFGPELMLLLVDQKVVQFNFPKLSDVLGGKSTTNSTEILKLHQKWEIDFQSEQVFKRKLIAENEDLIFLNLKGGKSIETYFWTYQRPEGDNSKQFTGDAFQSLIIGDRMMVVGSPLTSNQDLSEQRRYFNGTLSSLVFFAKETAFNAPKPAPTKTKAKTSKTKTKP